MINNFITFFFIASLLKRRAIWTPNIAKKHLLRQHIRCVCGVLIYFPMTYVLTFSTHCWRRVRKKALSYETNMHCGLARWTFCWKHLIQLAARNNGVITTITGDKYKFDQSFFRGIFLLALGFPQNRWKTTTLCYMQHLVQCTDVHRASFHTSQTRRWLLVCRTIITCWFHITGWYIISHPRTAMWRLAAIHSTNSCIWPY